MGIRIVFDATGVHVHKGLLKVRADLFIDDSAARTYSQRYVYIPVIPKNATDKQLENQAWLDALPHIWQLNPALCHFFAIPENANLENITEYLKENVFTPDNIASLDEYLTRPDSIHYISPFMRNIQKFTDAKVQTNYIEDLVLSTKTLLSGKAIDIKSGGKIIDIEPESIAVGPGAINRDTASGNNVRVTIDVPANADGNIDTFYVWLLGACTTGDGKVGVAYVVSGNNLTLRDYETVGNIASGSAIPFTGLTINVVTGDYAALEIPSGTVELDTSGGGGTWFYATNLFPFTDTALTWSADSAASLYATGTESGGGNIVPIIMQNMNQFDGGSYL